MNQHRFDPWKTPKQPAKSAEAVDEVPAASVPRQRMLPFKLTEGERKERHKIANRRWARASRGPRMEVRKSDILAILAKLTVFMEANRERKLAAVRARYEARKG